MNKDKPFKVAKTFGIGVLLKLTKKSVQGIDISSDGEKFTSNEPMGKVTDAVNATIKTHNINLKLK